MNQLFFYSIQNFLFGIFCLLLPGITILPCNNSAKVFAIFCANGIQVADLSTNIADPGLRTIYAMNNTLILIQ
jgi:hypothetical protein